MSTGVLCFSVVQKKATCRVDARSKSESQLCLLWIFEKNSCRYNSLMSTKILGEKMKFDILFFDTTYANTIFCLSIIQVYLRFK